MLCSNIAQQKLYIIYNNKIELDVYVKKKIKPAKQNKKSKIKNCENMVP